MEERVTELLLAGLEGLLFSDCETASWKKHDQQVKT